LPRGTEKDAAEIDGNAAKIGNCRMIRWERIGYAGFKLAEIDQKLTKRIAIANGGGFKRPDEIGCFYFPALVTVNDHVLFGGSVTSNVTWWCI
jgi:hypothetical protein